MALKESFEVVDPEELKLSWSGFDSQSPVPNESEKRRAIKKKLDDYNFVINMESITKAALDDVSDGEEMPDRINAMGVMDGIIFVRAFYDNTTKTGRIKTGHAVVFDTVTGNSVTGINDDWSADEYKIVGVALKDYGTVKSPDDELDTIPVRLTPPVDNIEAARIAITTHDPATTYPTYNESTRVFPIAFYTSPTFNETTGAFTGTSTGYKAKAYNIQRGFVPENVQFLTWQINGKWYFDWTPLPVIEFTLTEDLLPGSSASFSYTNPSGLPAIPSGMKVFAVALNNGYKFPNGIQGVALRANGRYIAVKFYSCPIPQ